MRLAARRSWPRRVSKLPPGAIELPDEGPDDEEPGDYSDRYAAALEAGVAAGASWDEVVQMARRCRYLPLSEQLAAIRTCTARRH